MAQPKIKLGNSPKNFAKDVEIVLLNGQVATLEISYIYRTRSQFATLLDEKADADAAAEKAVNDEIGKVADVATFVPKTFSDWFKEADEGGAKFVLMIADGWDLDDPFNEASLLQLEDENPGALSAIAVVYRQAVAEARVKNS